ELGIVSLQVLKEGQVSIRRFQNLAHDLVNLPLKALLFVFGQVIPADRGTGQIAQQLACGVRRLGEQLPLFDQQLQIGDLQVADFGANPGGRVEVGQNKVE